MHRIKLICITLVLLSAGLFTSGCALSPQSVTLMPTADISRAPYGKQRFAVVEVLDQRPSEVLGTRGGIYKDSSEIKLTKEMLTPLVTSTENILGQLGFKVGRAGADEPVAFTVIVADLVYTSPNKIYANKVNGAIELKLNVVDGGRTFSSSFKTNSTESFALVPSEEKNSVILNKMFSDTLEKLFNDPKLEGFFQPTSLVR